MGVVGAGVVGAGVVGAGVVGAGVVGAGVVGAGVGGAGVGGAGVGGAGNVTVARDLSAGIRFNSFFLMSNSFATQHMTVPSGLPSSAIPTRTPYASTTARPQSSSFGTLLPFRRVMHSRWSGSPRFSIFVSRPSITRSVDAQVGATRNSMASIAGGVCCSVIRIYGSLLVSPARNPARPAGTSTSCKIAVCQARSSFFPTHSTFGIWSSQARTGATKCVREIGMAKILSFPRVGWMP